MPQPMYTNDTPPDNYDAGSPEDFDPGPAIMTAASDAYNSVIENGGSVSDAAEAAGGAAATAAGELGVTPAEFNEGMSSFTEAFNTAQTEGGDGPTCMQAGMQAANAATDPDHSYDTPPTSDFAAGGEMPPPGEGLIQIQSPVPMPEEMTHNWEEGPMPADHPAETHDGEGQYGPVPEPMGEMGDTHPDTGDAAAVAHDVAVQTNISNGMTPDAAETAANVAESEAAGHNGGSYSSEGMGDGPIPTIAIPEADVPGGMDATPVIGDEGFVEAAPVELAGGEAMAAAEAAEAAAAAQAAATNTVPVIGDPDFVEAAPVPTPEGDGTG